MSDCAEIQEEISAMLDGELPAERREAVERHLASCEDCRRVLAAFTALSEAMEMESPPAESSARWLSAAFLPGTPEAEPERISRERGRKTKPVRRLWRRVLPAAACFLILAGAAFSGLPRLFFGRMGGSGGSAAPKEALRSADSSVEFGLFNAAAGAQTAPEEESLLEAQAAMQVPESELWEYALDSVEEEAAAETSNTTADKELRSGGAEPGAGGAEPAAGEAGAVQENSGNDYVSAAGYGDDDSAPAETENEADRSDLSLLEAEILAVTEDGLRVRVLADSGERFPAGTELEILLASGAPAEARVGDVARFQVEDLSADSGGAQLLAKGTLLELLPAPAG